MVRFIENEQGTRAEVTQNVSQARNVDFVRQKAVRDDETRTGRPRVHGETALAPQLPDALAIDNVEGKTEFALELIFPLHDHRRRRGNHHQVDPPA